MATYRTTSAIIGTMLLGVAVPTALQANPILYGDFSGATVDFLDVNVRVMHGAVGRCRLMEFIGAATNESVGKRKSW